MLNAIQERKRCNRLVIIPWRNTIPFQGLIGDHFGVDVERNGDHFGVDLGIFSGLGIISGAVQNLISDRGSCYTGYPFSGTRTIPGRTSVHTWERWFRRDFCNGVNLRRANLFSGEPYIGKGFILWRIALCADTKSCPAYCKHSLSFVGFLFQRSREKPVQPSFLL